MRPPRRVARTNPRATERSARSIAALAAIGAVLQALGLDLVNWIRG